MKNKIKLGVLISGLFLGLHCLFGCEEQKSSTPQPLPRFTFIYISGGVYMITDHDNNTEYLCNYREGGFVKLEKENNGR